MRSIASAIAVVVLLSLVAGCQKTQIGPMDGVSGFVAKNHQIEPDALILPEIRLDSDIKNYTIIERFVFLGAQDTIRRAVEMTFRRALKDNKFIRAERDFSGFVLEGAYWQALPYTKMRHDSTKLATQIPFTFGGITWREAGKAGMIAYNWRGVSLNLEFSDLRPVQFNEHGANRRSHGVGTATLNYQGLAVTGSIAYELICLDDYNAIDKSGEGIEYTNYDWMMLLAQSGEVVLASADSTTAGDRVLKNFLVVSKDGALSAAEGSQYVRIQSSELQRDRKIFEWLAGKKTLEQIDLGMSFDVRLQEARLFYTSGFAIAEVGGQIMIGGQSQSAWGVLEHWQQPKSDGEVLK